MQFAFTLLCNDPTFTIKLAAISTVTLLTACATGQSNTATNAGKNNDNCRQQVGQSTDGKAVDVCFPDQGNAWLKNGTFENVENMRRMNVGMNEDRVQHKDGLSQNIYWNKPGCAEVLTPKVG